MITRAKMFVPFSVQQRKVLTWWTDKSPHKDKDGIIAEGSVRSGKTMPMTLSFVFWSLKTHHDQNFIVGGKSMGALKRNVIKPLISMMAALKVPVKYHRSTDDPHLIIGTNTYYLFGGNNEASQDVIQGLTAAGSLLDEIALMPENFVEQVLARCSVDNSRHFWNCNPENPRHFIKTEFIDKAEEKRFLVLHFTMDDNPSLSRRAKDRFKRLFTGLFFKRFILGLWCLAEGAIYDMFDEGKHVIPANRQAEILKNVVIIWTATDYGTGTVLCHGLFGMDRQGIVYLLRTSWWDAKERGRQKTDTEYAEDLKRLVSDGQAAQLAATHNKPLSVTCHVIPDDALSFIAQCRKTPGLGMIRIYKREPGTVLQGIRHQANLLAQGKYFLFAARGNEHVISEYASYVWDPKAQERGEDAPLKQHDHGKDMERYSLMAMAESPAGRTRKPAGY